MIVAKLYNVLYSVLTLHFSFRTHWKTTSCKPSSPEEELAAERSPTGSSSGYDYCPSIASGKLFILFRNADFMVTHTLVL